MLPNNDPMKYGIDGVSLTLIAGTLAGWLPTIAAGLSVVWVIIRIYESCTVQKLLHGARCNPWEKKDGS